MTYIRSFLIFIIFSFTLYSQDKFARVAGPAGSDIICIAINSNDIIFAGSWGKGIYRSNDGGGNWTQVNNGLDNMFVSALAVDSDNNLYAGTYGGGIFKSDDNGDSWTEKNTGLSNLRISTIGQHDNGDIYVGTRGMGVFRTADGGDNWEWVSSGIRYLDITDIIFADNGNIVASSWGDGFFRTEDTAKTWKRSSGMLSNDFIHNMTENSVGEIFASSNGRGIVLSNDWGVSWREYDTTIADLNTTSVLFNDNSELIAGTRSKGLWYVDELLGLTFIISNIKNSGINDIAMASNGDLYACSPRDGVLKSINNGRLWTYIGLRNTFFSMNIWLESSELLIVNDADGRVLRTLDYGNSWEEIDLGAFPIDMEIAGDTIFAATSSGVRYSADYGDTWTTIAQNGAIISSIIAVEGKGIIYATFDPEAEDNKAWLYRTRDLGVSTDTLGVFTDEITILEYNPDNNVYLYNPSFGFYHSDDFGTGFWIRSQPNGRITDLAFRSTGDMLASTSNGLYISANNGNSWQPNNVGFESPPNLSCIEVTTNDSVYVGSGAKLGLHYTDMPNLLWWENFNADFNIHEINDLNLTKEGDIFFSVGSLQRSIDSANIGTPSLISPNDKEVGLRRHPILTWNSTQNADMYVLEISFNKIFTGVFERITLSDTTWKIFDELDFNKEYFWRVCGKNEQELGAWSQVRSFRTFLAPPVLSSPESDTMGTNLSLTLCWEEVEGAISYTLEYSTSPDFSAGVTTISALVETCREINVTDYLATYYWRVMAHSQETESDWSEVWNFTTKLPAPSLRLPENGATELYINLDFLWDKVPTGIDYVIQLSKNPEFNPVAFDGETLTDSTHRFLLLGYNTKYYWRVRAVNEHGTSDWSEAWSFETAIREPELVDPPSGTFDAELSIKLFWEDYNGADSYHLQFGTDDSFSDNIVEITDLDINELQIDNLDFYTTYYWRVRVNIDDRHSYWSETWNIRTLMGPTFLSKPDNNSTGLNLAVRLEWDATKGAELYHVQVSKSNVFDNLLFEDDKLQLLRYNISGLETKTTYYWRAKAYNDETGNDWSDTWNFRTADTITSVDYITTKDMLIYPNPFSDALFIETGFSFNEIKTVRVFDVFGRDVSKDGIDISGDGIIRWEPHGLADGTYFFRIETPGAYIGGTVIHNK